MIKIYIVYKEYICIFSDEAEDLPRYVCRILSKNNSLKLITLTKYNQFQMKNKNKSYESTFKEFMCI